MSTINQSALISKQYYHNIITKQMFKLIVKDFSDKDSSNDKTLMEKVFIGAMAAITLDCIADVKHKELNIEKTKKHYLEYVKIARKSNIDREDVRLFISEIENLCSNNNE